MILGLIIIALLGLIAGYQCRENVEVCRRSAAEDKLREANIRNAELADRLSRSYGEVTYSVRGKMYRD